jgi:small-conductance mechanosensitive channel
VQTRRRGGLETLPRPWAAVLLGFAAALLVALAAAAPRHHHHHGKKHSNQDASALPADAGAPDAARDAASTDAAARDVKPEAAPAPSASAARSAAPSAAPEVRPLPVGVPVRIHNTVAFVVRVGHRGETARARAAAASQALRAALPGLTPDDVHVTQGGQVAVIYAGKAPVIQLYPEDAQAAGDASLEVNAASVAASIRGAIRKEQKQTAIATIAISLSLLLVFGILALYLLRKIGQFSRRGRAYIAEHPERIPAIRLKSIEVVRPAALRGAAVVALGIGKWIVQIALVYVWLVVSLSMFASTRGYTARLTGFVLAPLSTLTARVAGSLPVLFVAVIAGIAVFILVRFVGLFFDSVARSETQVAWLSPDLAQPTSIVARVAIVVAALVFAAPVVTGSEGALTRAGAIVLIAIALSSTPLVASALTGMTVLYLRRLRIGDFVEYGGRTGRVKAVGLLDVRLEDREECEVRVPHLLSLVHPTRLIGTQPRVIATLSVAPGCPATEVLQVLLDAANAVGEASRAELVGQDATGAEYRVATASSHPDALSQLNVALSEALARAGIPLAGARSRP